MKKTAKSEKSDLKPMLQDELMRFLSAVVDEYVDAYHKHPEFASVILDERADIAWIQENLREARKRLEEQNSADHVVNCEWMESLEEWKLATESKTKTDLEMHKDAFVTETAQAIATMIRYLQLGMKDIAARAAEISKTK